MKKNPQKQYQSLKKAAFSFFFFNKNLKKKKKKKNPHLYEGSQVQIWLLYGKLIDTDVWGIFSSTFSSRDHKLTIFVTDL